MARTRGGLPRDPTRGLRGTSRSGEASFIGSTKTGADPEGAVGYVSARRGLLVSSMQPHRGGRLLLLE